MKQKVEEPFILSKEMKPIALLPNLGRFCRCGCGKRIEGKRITRKFKTCTVNFYRKPRDDQIFATRNCKNKHQNKGKSHHSKSNPACRLELKIQNDGQPYRLLSIYVKPGLKFDTKVRPNTEVWETIETYFKRRSPIQ